MMKAQEEKKLERAIKGYKRQYAKKHPKVAKRDAEAEKMLDEEVADEVAKAIWATAHLKPGEQVDKLFDKYTFWWLDVPDVWPVSDVLNRLMLDEKEAKRLLCERFVRPHFGKNDDNADILSARIHDGKFVHFQMTRACTWEHVVSGGQTGVDQGALHAAIDLGLAWGGIQKRTCRFLVEVLQGMIEDGSATSGERGGDK